MKQIIVLLCISCITGIGFAQVIPVTTEQQLEQQASMEEQPSEDDSYWQNMEQFRRHPLDLNSADAEALGELGIFNALQVANFIAYRNLLGKLVSIYELQAVPGWDIAMIRRILPFIRLSDAVPITEQFRQRFRGGDHLVLLRLSQTFETPRPADNSKYNGSMQRVLLRYRYQFKQLLQFGLTADKDAGESFFARKTLGFDFYSIHLFARKIGIIHSLAIGDFAVSMGQGLIQWQGFAVGKSNEAMSIKRQSPVLRPYSSAGEFYFFRGAGLTLRKGRSEATVFASVRKMSATIDTVNGFPVISSFQTSGYHRTPAENATRNNSRQSCAGINVQYHGKQWRIGMNAIAWRFSLPLKRKEEPYNLYAINGSHWFNASIDYEYTWKNVHLFGEWAIDRRFSKAMLTGLLISVDPRVDLSFLYRNINASYKAVNGNAFTENTQPTNETGYYAGISIRPATGWRINAFADVFHFPWLNYRVDAPAGGVDYSIQLTYSPDKRTEINSSFHYKRKPKNKMTVEEIPQQRWRMHVNYQSSAAWNIRGRVELVWYDNKSATKETGCLLYTDVIYKPMLRRYNALFRIQFFETNGYDSRIYAYENDVLYASSIPSFSGKGYSYYVVLNYDIDKRFSIGMRLRKLITVENKTVSSATVVKNTECKMQFIYFFDGKQ